MEGFSCYDRSFIFCPKGREKVLVECVSRNILTRGAKREQTLPISSFPIVNIPKNKSIPKKMFSNCKLQDFCRFFACKGLRLCAYDGRSLGDQERRKPLPAKNLQINILL